MDFLNLFWNFDASSNTKLLIFGLVALFFLFILCRPKNADKSNQVQTMNKINEIMTGENHKKNKSLTRCQIDHKICQENAKRGNTNGICHVCKPNGDYPDKIYNPDLGWINVDPKTGKPAN